jgi:hypothetical protein
MDREHFRTWTRLHPDLTGATINAMKALEIDAEITTDHSIPLKLPDEVYAGRARVIVLYDTDRERPASVDGQGNLDAFLSSLPKNSPSCDRHAITAAILNTNTNYSRI